MNKGTIIRNIETGALARITHWNHMWINRRSGAVWDNAFIYVYLDGEMEGSHIVERTDNWESSWERVYASEAIERVQ